MLPPICRRRCRCSTACLPACLPAILSASAAAADYELQSHLSHYLVLCDRPPVKWQDNQRAAAAIDWLTGRKQSLPHRSPNDFGLNHTILTMSFTKFTKLFVHPTVFWLAGWLACIY
jgi:hypothetical protein